jgi:hypothetical protein
MSEKNPGYVYSRITDTDGFALKLDLSSSTEDCFASFPFGVKENETTGKLSIALSLTDKPVAEGLFRFCEHVSSWLKSKPSFTQSPSDAERGAPTERFMGKKKPNQINPFLPVKEGREKKDGTLWDPVFNVDIPASAKVVDETKEPVALHDLGGMVVVRASFRVSHAWYNAVSCGFKICLDKMIVRNKQEEEDSWFSSEHTWVEKPFPGTEDASSTSDATGDLTPPITPSGLATPGAPVKKRSRPGESPTTNVGTQPSAKKQCVE